nr:peroxide stress protein YaaA [Paludibacter sp.]
MLILLSPAKIQNFEKQTVTNSFTLPKYMSHAEKLISLMRQLSPTEISKLLAINAKLTELNYDRYFNWHIPFTPQNAKQAALVFDGEVFRGLDAKSFSESDFEFAQQHLMILSGLYGVLRPLDLIQPYRLEISSALANEQGKNLYSFWKNTLTKHVLD